ncbi:hypothetical protein ACFYM5_17770 [Streptomyces sp. NPDC006706]|uniref:hypothetical protein n=1 Tax=Streptomyces sp. NPDC006706 TaxID=3364761 RepID=UPI00367E90D8
MPSTFVGEDGRTYRLISGTIRNTDTGWQLINDSGHRPSGITAVITNADHIEIRHSVGAVRVSSFQVTPDETYAACGLRVGISAGLALSRIYLYTQPGCLQTPAPPAAPAGINAANGNLWITGLLEI